MHAFFKSTGFHIISNDDTSFMVGLLFWDEEVEVLKQQGRWENNLELKDLLLKKISPIDTGFSDMVKVIVVMDSSFIIRKIKFDEDFLKQSVVSGDFNKVQEMVLQAVNAATKNILKSMEKHILNNNISMKDYIDRILLNHEKKDLWINLKTEDERGNVVGFYPPYGESGLQGLQKLERYN